jgi:hypothetical protein
MLNVGANKPLQATPRVVTELNLRRFGKAQRHGKQIALFPRPPERNVRCEHSELVNGIC